MRVRIATFALCGLVWGWASGSDLSEIVDAFLPDDSIGMLVRMQAAVTIPVGGAIGGGLFYLCLGAFNVVGLPFVVGLAAGTIVGLVVDRPESWKLIHPVDIASAVAWQQLTTLVGGATVWAVEKAAKRLQSCQ